MLHRGALSIWNAPHLLPLSHEILSHHAWRAAQQYNGIGYRRPEGGDTWVAVRTPEGPQPSPRRSACTSLPPALFLGPSHRPPSQPLPMLAALPSEPLTLDALHVFLYIAMHFHTTCARNRRLAISKERATIKGLNYRFYACSNRVASNVNGASTNTVR